MCYVHLFGENRAFGVGTRKARHELPAVSDIMDFKPGDLP